MTLMGEFSSLIGPGAPADAYAPPAGLDCGLAGYRRAIEAGTPVPRRGGRTRPLYVLHGAGAAKRAGPCLARLRHRQRDRRQ